MQLYKLIFISIWLLSVTTLCAADQTVPGPDKFWTWESVTVFLSVISLFMGIIYKIISEHYSIKKDRLKSNEDDVQKLLSMDRTIDLMGQEIRYLKEKTKDNKEDIARIEEALNKNLLELRTALYEYLSAKKH